MNNGKYHTKEYKEKQQQKTDKQYGPVKNHHKSCEKCGQAFIWTGRGKTKAFDRARFCSRSCANSRQDYWDKNISNYRTVAFKHHKKECAICGFDKIVEVHHIDEDSKNNSPENLIPLCPNHHRMYHSKYKNEIANQIPQLQKHFIAERKRG
jgi:hypothetical protein|tara:strand:- start:55 stop:510 length:456 start_codon:yes stop_codon:yes gene_type:complete